MRSLLALITLWTATSAAAVEFVDPHEIQGDSEDTLIPERVVTSCSQDEFGISLNEPIANKRAFQTPKVIEHPLPQERGLNVVPSCQHGSYLLEATLTSRPPMETGMCAATHSVRLQLHVNKKLVLHSLFANYCTGWGIHSVKASNYSGDTLGYLVVCGFWNVPSEVFGKGGSVLTYRCDEYPLDKMYEKNLLFVDGNVEAGKGG